MKHEPSTFRRIGTTRHVAAARSVAYLLSFPDEAAAWRFAVAVRARLTPRERVTLGLAALLALDPHEAQATAETAIDLLADAPGQPARWWETAPFREAAVAYRRERERREGRP